MSAAAAAAAAMAGRRAATVPPVRRRRSAIASLWLHVVDSLTRDDREPLQVFSARDWALAYDAREEQ